ncbi:hypothetical protein PT974_05692 [Cladobotryum mycophilum]|uniref:Heterokaryon incompatibility domain-containing protein n=1 Tax=Cladobotryum mycophilum TaxID=491253 RepID=A0ABR0SJG5_9HYPO
MQNPGVDCNPPVEALCSACKTIDLSIEKFLPVNIESKPLPNSGPVGTGSHQLDYIDEIYRRRAECSFCWLLYTAIRSQTQDSDIGDDGLTVEGCRVLCFVDWKLDGRFMSNEGGGIKQASGSHIITRRLRVYNPEGIFPDAYVLPLSHPESTETSTVTFLGRKILTHDINVSLIRKWIDLCVGFHDEDCRSALTMDQLSVLANKLMFVDVQAKRIVTREDLPTNGFQFATVSHIWGAQNFLKLTRSTLSEFRRGLPMDRLRKSLRDAILLVEALGIPYVWIDSLCIIQDSLESMKEMIDLMDQIYTNGLVNICITTGRPEDGTFGSELTPRQAIQVTVRCCGMELLAVRPVESHIRSSIWNTRAWTFQERILSRRSIIFVEGQVFFQCRQATWSEQVDSESKTPVWTLDMIESPLRSFLKNPVRLFSEFVELYSPRKLTIWGDRLVAFNGISASLCHLLRSSFVYGLPQSYFDWALLWEPKAASGHDKSSRQVFPSWSWCGWTGQMTWRPATVDGTLIDLHKWLTEHTWIVWNLALDESSFFDSLMWESPDVASRQPTRWDGYGSDWVQDRLIRNNNRRSKRDRKEHETRPSRQLIPGCLHFWSYTAFFQLSRRNMSSSRFHSNLGEGMHRFGILDSSGDWCGTIVLRDDFELVDKIVEFVAISEARDFSMEELDSWTYYVPEDREVSEWYLYYSLLIIRDREGDISERAGLAKIYKEAFQKASFPPGMDWREITLA